MAVWTVLIKSDKGDGAHHLEAEFAEYSDDEKFLVFTNASEPVMETFEALRAALDGHSSEQVAKDAFRRLIRALAGFEVGRFRAEVVQAYFRGIEVQKPLEPLTRR